MPTYVYRCDNGHQFEVFQSITADPVSECEECGAPATRLLFAPAIHFKGKGFHNTDYGTKRRNRELEKSAKDGADKHDAKMADKQAEKKKDKKADAKPAAKKAGSSGPAS